MKSCNRCFAFLGVLLVLLLFPGRQSHAQFPGPNPAMNPMGMMRDMQSSPLFLLMRPEVQKELKLDKSQNEQIKKIQKEQEALAKEREKISRSTDLALMTEEFNKMQASLAELNSRAKAVLNDAQKQRFGEIRVQAMGIQAVADPEVQTALGVTPEQKTLLAALSSEHMLARMNAYRDIRNAKKKQESLDKEFAEKVTKALTAEQVARWKTLEGEPFKDIKKIKMM